MPLLQELDGGWMLARVCRGPEPRPELPSTQLHSLQIRWPRAIPETSRFPPANFHKVPFRHPQPCLLWGLARPSWSPGFTYVFPSLPSKALFFIILPVLGHFTELSPLNLAELASVLMEDDQGPAVYNVLGRRAFIHSWSSGRYLSLASAELDGHRVMTVVPAYRREYLPRPPVDA